MKEFQGPVVGIRRGGGRGDRSRREKGHEHIHSFACSCTSCSVPYPALSKRWIVLSGSHTPACILASRTTVISWSG